MKTIIDKLTRKEMIAELKKHGFSLSEIVKNASDTVENNNLWFSISNDVNFFVVSFNQHTKKRWSIVYAPITNRQKFFPLLRFQAATVRDRSKGSGGFSADDGKKRYILTGGLVAAPRAASGK